MFEELPHIDLVKAQVLLEFPLTSDFPGPLVIIYCIVSVLTNFCDGLMIEVR